MPAPASVEELVQRFAGHVDSYRSGQYNEAQVRREFLDPFFEALGWDVYNRKGYAEAYKEVIHEDAIKVGGRTKAPDYCFRAGGGQRSFFVEAKKPSVDIREAVSPAYQLRRYAWSAKLPVSILTDFVELAVYDCRIRPEKNDKPSVARIIYSTLHRICGALGRTLRAFFAGGYPPWFLGKAGRVRRRSRKARPRSMPRFWAR